MTNADGTGGQPTWIPLVTTGPAPVRRAHTAAFDAAGNRLIVYGGMPSVTGLECDETWVLTNANGLGGAAVWTKLAPASAIPFGNWFANGPAGYDPATDSLVAFDSYDLGNGYLSKARLLHNANGLGGSPLWTELVPSGELPPMLMNAAGVYEAGRNRMVLFGGAWASYFNDVWRLDYANGLGGAPQWTKVEVAGESPAPRQFNGVTSRAGYNAQSDRLIIYGGIGVAYHYDVWVLTEAMGTGPVNNRPPTANAGLDQTIHEANATVTLNGSGSTDPDGDSLTHAWSFISKPEGSVALLSDPNGVNPTFSVDKEGNYVLQLVVTDSKGLASAPDTVTISTSNTKPVAGATADPQAVILVGTTVQLGSTSYDEDGDSLTYEWNLSRPDGSNASLSYPTSDKPAFVADVHGDYYATLVVRDTWGAVSNTAEVKISFDNLMPVADAGTAPSTHVGETVTLNGSGSRDPNSDPLTYQWNLTTKPAGSSATLSGDTTVSSTFVPDLPGTYVAQLVVTDTPGLASTPSTVEVQVVTLATWATEMIQTEVQPTIADLAPDTFVNPNLQKSMMNKTNAVIVALQAGNLQDARDKLQNDLLKKVDGCATTGAPDKNDWIKDCASQTEVYQQLLAVIQELGG